MTANAAEKDETLQEVMRRIEQARQNTTQAIAKIPPESHATIAHFTGELCAYSRMYHQCKGMLGHEPTGKETEDGQSIKKDL